MDKVKVALIGAGSMANSVHYPSLVEFSDVEIVGLCDLVEEKLKATAEKFHISRTYSDYRKMLEATAPTAVYVLMPPYHLYDVVVSCLQSGLHVFLEKPPAVTKEQTRQLALLAEKKGCRTMVGFQRRFAPLIVRAKEEVDKRGGVLQCQASFFKCYLNQPPYYNGAIDVLTSDAIHSVDILRYLAGEPRKVVSSVRSLFADYDNSFNALIEFERKAVGFLSTNWVSGTRIYSVEIHGKGICAFVNPEIESVTYRDGNNAPEILKAERIVGSKEIFKIGGFYQENRHFIDCLKQKKLPLTNLTDSLKTMELVDRIYHSQL
jgi:predicted dehydrogenase